MQERERERERELSNLAGRMGDTDCVSACKREREMERVDENVFDLMILRNFVIMLGLCGVSYNPMLL